MPVKVFADVPPLEGGHFGTSQSAVDAQHDDGSVPCPREGIRTGSDQQFHFPPIQMGSRWLVVQVVAVSLPVDSLDGHLKGLGGEGVGGYLSGVFQVIHEAGNSSLLSADAGLGVALLSQ